MSRRGAVLVAGAAIAVALLVAGCGGGSSSNVAPKPQVGKTRTADRLRGTPVLRGATAADFALRDQNGAVVRLSAQRGRLVLLTFLYTDCPDVCPLIAANLNGVLTSLTAKERQAVRVVAVSVDPVHDTARAVKAYVASHRLLPQFSYLIGSREELKPIWQAYNLLVETQNAERVSHSTYVLLIDRSGKPRLYYSRTVGTSSVLHDVRQLMHASASRSSNDA